MEISKAALVPRTVSSNRSFSYAIFKRRIHDALTTILFQEFFHFLFIYSSSFLYIYIYTYMYEDEQKQYIIINMVLPIFFFSFLYYFFFFFPFVTDRNISSFFESKRTIWLTRRPCSFFSPQTRVRSVFHRFYKVVLFDLCSFNRLPTCCFSLVALTQIGNTIPFFSLRNVERLRLKISFPSIMEIIFVIRHSSSTIVSEIHVSYI